jgi:hypothetical protein
MNARCPSQLSDALNTGLNIFSGDDHQVRQFIDNHNDPRH